MNQASQILAEVKKAVCGKDRVLIWVLTVILAKGHILLEDIPGVGKTTMALAFSRALGLDYGRVQFTPDVLPSDITGYSIFDKESGTMRYQPGVILCNLFLADELNRATSRTQSALLEAMEEGQVTVDGVSHRIPEPFCVFATQNPTGASGTQLGYENVFIGTVEGEPEETSCEAVIEAVKAAGYTNVILRPLMVVAGDHANNDMAGSEDDSWKTMFEAAGFTVDCQIAGLGEIADVQALYVAHTKAAIEALNA